MKSRTEKEKSEFIELNKIREKISNEMKNLIPEKLNAYISRQLSKEKKFLKKTKRLSILKLKAFFEVTTIILHHKGNYI